MRKNTMSSSERRQQIALCTQTYYRLNGIIPDAADLCGWLDESYYAEIVKYLSTASFQAGLCA